MGAVALAVVAIAAVNQDRPDGSDGLSYGGPADDYGYGYSDPGYVSDPGHVSDPGPDADYTAVCVEEVSQERVDDDECEPQHSGTYHGGYGWYYIPRGVGVPTFGSPPSGGSLTVPPSGTSYRTTSGWSSGTTAGTTSGVVTRGGFTGSSTTGRGGSGSRSSGGSFGG